MSSTGCGFPTPLGSEVVTCGTRLLGLGDIMPVLCPACLDARYGASTPDLLDAEGSLACTDDALRTPQIAPGTLCEGCREERATRTTSPFLCDACEAEYAADLAVADRPDDMLGSACSPSCGMCGACT